MKPIWIALNGHVRPVVVLWLLAGGLPVRVWSEEDTPVPDAVIPLEFRVYPLLRPAAPEWVELLREAAGPAARILAGQRAELYVRATPAAHDRIAESFKTVTPSTWVGWERNPIFTAVSWSDGTGPAASAPSASSSRPASSETGIEIVIVPIPTSS